MRKTMWVTASALLFLIGASPLQAQTGAGENRGFLGVNIGLQPGRTTTETARPEIYTEPATITLDHEAGVFPLIDFMVGYRLRGDVGVAVGYSFLGSSDSPTLSAQIPHPLGTDRHRDATATADDLGHSESAFHVLLAWMTPLNEDWELTALVGPSFYRVKQDVIGSLSLSESPAPAFTSVSITGVVPESESKSAVGFTVGLDATYVVTPRIGGGGFVRFSRASADIPVAGGGTMEMTAGGLQIGFGLRVRF